MYCSNCGNQIEENANFCDSCGHRVKKNQAFLDQRESNHFNDLTEQPLNDSNDDRLEETTYYQDGTNATEQPHQETFISNDDTQDEVNSLDDEPAENSLEEDMLVYVGKNSQFYDQKWKVTEVKGTSWNWASFFLGIGWLGYRKMYKPVVFIALIFLMIDVLLYFIDQALFGVSGFINSLNSGLGIGLGVVLGLYGNTLYQKHTRKNTMEIRSIYEDRKRRNFMLSHKGGTSVGGVFAAMGIMIGIYVIPSLLIPFQSYTVEGVKGGTFYEYPDVVIEELFDAVFDHTSWEFAGTEADHEYVEFSGTIRSYDYDVDVTIQFVTYGDEFEISNIFINGEALSEYEIYDFLEYIFLEYDSI